VCGEREQMVKITGRGHQGRIYVNADRVLFGGLVPGPRGPSAEGRISMQDPSLDLVIFHALSYLS
jgi:hypothetical protein